MMNPLTSTKTYWSILKSFLNNKKIPWISHSSISIKVNKTVFVFVCFLWKNYKHLNTNKNATNNFYPYNIHKQKHCK